MRLHWMRVQHILKIEGDWGVLMGVNGHKKGEKRLHLLKGEKFTR